VHICSGATATAISLYLSYPLARSRRSEIRTPSHLKLHRPHNSLSQLLAMIIIWGSWLAFDAGTTLSLNFQSINALAVTNLCASAGAMTWSSMTYYETGKWSLDSTFMGAIAGLVMITPAAGFIDLPTAFFFGLFGAVICRQALRIKSTKTAARWRWVDNGDTFATHCIGGFLGTIATGLFAQKKVAAYGGLEVDGGVFFDGNVRQLGVQIVSRSVLAETTLTERRSRLSWASHGRSSDHTSSLQWWTVYQAAKCSQPMRKYDDRIREISLTVAGILMLAWMLLRWMRACTKRNGRAKRTTSLCQMAIYTWTRSTTTAVDLGM
jgi:hypothetical protein